eukprot:gene5481-7589_t
MVFPKLNRNNVIVSSLVALFGLTMFSIPYIVRSNWQHTESREKISGSMRQRGLYMNTGAHDAGIDPDWDRTTRKWKGYKNRDEIDEQKHEESKK